MSARQSMSALLSAAHHTGESVLSLPYSVAKISPAYSQQEDEEDRSRQLFDRRRGVVSKFMRLVSRLPRLREDAVQEEVLGRQKRRELGFKMSNVSTSYAKFMSEIQTLVAQGKLDGFPELLKLATECQEARDKLGPLEAECTEAEQEWEWKFSKLQIAEASAYDFYEANFDATELNLSGPSSASSSQYGSSSDNNSQYMGDEFNDSQNDIRYQSMPSVSSQHHSSLAVGPLYITPSATPSKALGQTSLEVKEQGGEIDQLIHSSPRDNSESYYSDSVSSGAIDRVLESGPDQVFTIPEYPQELKRVTDIENYPQLLLEFATVRERVTNWLLHRVLVSRWEARQLKDRLEAEDPKYPSNWAQLVLAWWEKDIAAAPESGFNNQPYTTSHQKGPIVSGERTFNSKRRPASGQIGPDGIVNTLSNSDYNTAVSGDSSHSTGQRSPRGSSQTFASVPVGPGHPFVKLLFEQEDLKDLFRRVSDSVESSIFMEILGKLLGSFSDTLIQEAKYQNEIVASRFIHRLRRRIAIQIEERVYRLNNNQSNVLSVGSSDPGQDRRINHCLEQRVEGLPETSDVQKKTKNGSDKYGEGNNTLTSLEHVKDFILKSAAFREFRRNLEDMFRKASAEALNDINIGTGQSTTSKTTITALELDSEAHQQKNGDAEQAVWTDVLQHTTEGSLPTEVLASPPSIAVAPASRIEMTAALEEIKSNRAKVSATILPTTNIALNCGEIISSDSNNALPVSLARRAEGNNHALCVESSLADCTKTSEPERLSTEETPIRSSDVQNPEDPQTQTENDYPNTWSEQLWDKLRESYHQAHETSKGTATSRYWKISANKISEHHEFDDDGPPSPFLISRTDENVDITPTQVQSVDRAESGGSSQSIVEPEPELNSSTSQTHVTRTSTRKEEKFDKNYKEHEKKEFRLGKVFKVLWSEPTGSGGEGGTAISVRGQDDEKSIAKVRRFVIIDVKLEHCLCLAIMTYGGRGTTKGGVRADDHAIIHTEKPVLMDGETEMAKPAIKVKPYSPQHKLESASRINYAKVYSVEYNVKVWFIGEVHHESDWKLMASYNEMHPPLQPRIFPATLSSSSTTSYFPVEPPSPSVYLAQHGQYSPDTVSSAALSQSSDAPVRPGSQKISTSERGDEGNRPWEAPRANLYHGQMQYPPAHQDSPTQRLKDHFSQVLHDHLRDGK